MNDESQLKLQAFLDGELPPRETAEVAAWLERDAEAGALATELRHTAAALAGHEAGLKMPALESRDFYWSKIRREIERQSVVDKPRRAISWGTWFWRSLAPAGALAFVCALVLRSARTEAATESSPDLDVASDDMGAHTFQNQQTGLTSVWYYDRAGSAAAETAPTGSVTQ
jgi:anti-sigma factor RsiW